MFKYVSMLFSVAALGAFGGDYFARPIPVVVHRPDWRGIPTTSLYFEASRIFPTNLLPVAHGPNPSVVVPSVSSAKAAWHVPVENYLSPYALSLPAPEHPLPLGRYILSCWADEDGDGAFTPGEPFGCTPVHLSTGIVERAAIELAEISPFCMRINLEKAISRQSQYASEIAALAGSTESPETQAAAAAAAKASCFNDVAAATDRGVWNEPSAGLYCPYFIGTNILATATNDVVVKVMRSHVNRVSSAGSAKPVIERKFKFADHPVFTELDIMREMIDTGKWDFDWGGARSTGAWSVITSATYRIVVGTGSTSNFDWNNNLAVAFENRFEAGSYQTPVTNCEATIASGQPTFRWRHTPLKESGAGKLYPAFQLRIWEADGTTLVYDSGVQRAPARDANGVYSWTAPVWTGMLTPQNKVLKADTDYIWGVSMLDAKFINPLPANKEGRQALRVSDSGNTVLSGIVNSVRPHIPVLVTHVDWRELWRPSLAFELRRRPLCHDSSSVVSSRRRLAWPIVQTWSTGEVAALPYAAALPPPDRPLPVGDYILSAWADENVDGAFTPGEPFGCRRFSLTTGTLDRVAIEIMEVHPSLPRIDLGAALAIQRAHTTAGVFPPDAAAVSSAFVEIADGCTDRGKWGMPWAGLEAPDFFGTNMFGVSSGKAVVTLRTAWLNNEVFDGDVILERNFDLGAGKILTEADYMETNLAEAGRLDPGWWSINTKHYNGGHNAALLTNVTFSLEVTPLGDTSDSQILGLMPVMFRNAFHRGSRQPTVTNAFVSVAAGIPTFRWSHPNLVAKPYPAFSLRIWEDNGTNIVYDSGIRYAPPRDDSGAYVWSAPVCLDAGDYKFDLLMLDAKFSFLTAPNRFWEFSVINQTD